MKTYCTLYQCKVCKTVMWKHEKSNAKCIDCDSYQIVTVAAPFAETVPTFEVELPETR